MYLGGDGEHAVGGVHPSSGLFGDDCHDVHLVPVALFNPRGQSVIWTWGFEAQLRSCQAVLITADLTDLTIKLGKKGSVR